MSVKAPRLLVGPACLMFFTDETGHETFADPQYPVFGLGGCATIRSDTEENIVRPWRALKAEYFGGEDVPLHANDLKHPTHEQLAALSKFFRDQVFARFAVTMSKSVTLPPGMTPFDLAALSLAKRWQDLLGRLSPAPNEVALLHEASERCDQLVERAFGGTVVEIDGKQVPVYKGWIAKSDGVVELEVADFIMHAAGRRARQLHNDPKSRAGKDFDVVFKSNPRLCSYIHITESEIT
jgi:uncharacterized protein DUF3800